MATALDGYPLARQGYPGKALAIAAYSSFSGGTIALITRIYEDLIAALLTFLF